MKKLAALLFLLLTFTGCLEVDAQDLVIHHDAAADRIDLMLVHRGLFAEGGNGSDKDPLAKAVRDLAEVKATGEVVFWENWPLSVDLTREYAAPVKAMLAHVDVENGGLFTDPMGRLCGVQFVRIRKAAEFTRKLNTLLEILVQTLLVDGMRGFGGEHAFDADTRDLVREFARAKERFAVLEPGRIEVRLPLSKKDHAWLLGQLEERIVRNVGGEVARRIGVDADRKAGGDPTDTSVRPESVALDAGALPRELQRTPTLRFLCDHEWSLVRTAERTTIVLGTGESPELRVRKASDGLYHDALLKKLREANEAIEEGLPDQELERRFLAFRGREAVLPPKVAELRAGKAAPAETGGK